MAGLSYSSTTIPLIILAAVFVSTISTKEELVEVGEIGTRPVYRESVETRKPVGKEVYKAIMSGERIYCRYCGMLIQVDSIYCMYCGRRLR